MICLMIKIALNLHMFVNKPGDGWAAQSLTQVAGDLGLVLCHACLTVTHEESRAS